MARVAHDKQKRGGVGSKRRRLRPDARRVELLEAALSVLRSRGPTNARVEDVTEAAGAAKGTFYLYFSSWDDLLVKVRAHLLSQYISEMRTRFAAEARSDWWAAFENECVRFVAFIEELGELHEAVFHGPIADRPIDNAISSEAIIAGMLRTGIESGECRPVEINVAARLLFAVLHTTVDCIIKTGERDRYLCALFDLLRAWLRTPGAMVTEQTTST